MAIKTVLLSGISLFGWSAAFYVSHLSLVLLSTLPAAVRTYQIYHGNTPFALEVLVEMLRLVLVAAMIYCGSGRSGPLIAAETWRTIWKSAFARTAEIAKEQWVKAAVKYAVVIALMLVFNKCVDFVFTANNARAVMDGLSIGGLDAAPAAQAGKYFVKNIFVIPVTLVSVLRLIRWI